MILVTGATGNIGKPLTERLVSAGHKVRVVARDVGKAAAALGAAVHVVAGDLTRPETLPPALEGVERAFFMSGAGPELSSIGAAFFDAARTAGVKHVVALSSGTVNFEVSTAIGRWHLEMEEKLKATKLLWTMLRPGNFASNTVRWAHMIRTQGSVFAPMGDGKSAPIDPRDIAAVAFHALTEEGHDGKAYTLTGSLPVSTREQVATLAKLLGKEIRFVEVPEAGARAGMIGSGMPEMMADAILELIRAGAGRDGSLKTDTVRDVTGREARTFEDWARDHAAAFA